MAEYIERDAIAEKLEKMSPSQIYKLIAKVCNAYLYHSYDNHCPNCEAKMDGEER